MEHGMISLEIYKALHYVAIFSVVLALGGLGFVGVIDQQRHHPWRKAASIAHGVGVFLILLSGFGLLARLGMTDGLPVWVWLKVAVLLFVGGALVLIKRLPKGMGLWLLLLVIAVSFAGYLGSFKPYFN